MYRKQKTLAIIAMLSAVALVVSVHQVRAEPRFAIASWDYPDEYGQGIYSYGVYENSTGSWIKVNYTGSGWVYHDSFDSDVFQWNSTGSIKLRVYTVLNKTTVGVSTSAEGQNFQRHNLTVVDVRTTVFSKQNFTYYSVMPEGSDRYLYAYDVVLNFLPLDGHYYTVTMTYEVFW